MSQHGTGRAQIAFQDVAVYFVEEKWDLLQEFEKKLYRNVMKEIHQTLIFLGYQIANPDTLVRIFKREEALTQDVLNTQNNVNKPSASHQPDLLFRIKQEEDWHCKDWYNLEDPEIICSRAGDTFTNSDVMCKKMGKENQYITDTEGREDLDSNSPEHAVVSFIVKEEQESCYMEYQDCENTENRKGFTDEVILIPNEKDIDFEKHRQVLSCKPSLKEVRKIDLDRSESELWSECQLWTGSNQDREEEEQAICERILIDTSLFNLNPKTTVPQALGTYNECDRNGRVANVSTTKKNPQPKQRPYTCMVCGKSFYQRGHFNVHMRIHSGEKPHQCTECGKSFCQKNNLTRHQRIHTRTQIWEILTKRTLPNKFTDTEGTSRLKPSLIIQERNHTQCTPDQSTKREKSISDKKHLVEQNTVHLPQLPYQSNYCGNIFSQIAPSIMQQDTNREAGPNQLQKSEKSFGRARQLMQHHKRRPGTRRYHCTVCEKSFGQKGHIIAHQRTHSGERPYQCDKCKKSFCQKNNLTRHLRIHSGERPYQCTECGKGFNKKESFVAHITTHSMSCPKN